MFRSDSYLSYTAPSAIPHNLTIPTRYCAMCKAHLRDLARRYEKREFDCHSRRTARDQLVTNENENCISRAERQENLTPFVDPRCLVDKILEMSFVIFPRIIYFHNAAFQLERESKNSMRPGQCSKTLTVTISHSGEIKK